MSEENIATACLEAGRKLAGVQKIELPHGAFALAHQPETEVKFMDEEPPTRVKAVEVFRELPSFLAYVGAFRGKEEEDTEGLFVRQGWKPDEFDAILDYHRWNSPDHCGHRATLALIPSRSWLAWQTLSQTPVRQNIFAEFIEEHAGDIAHPDIAKLLEAVEGLQVTRTADISSEVNRTSGAVRMEFTEKDVVRSVALPSEIILVLEPFEGIDIPMRVVAKLRYRIQKEGDGRVLTLGFTLIQADKALRAVVATIRATIGETLGVHVYA